MPGKGGEKRWRPIKSAPQDGTMVLIAEPNPGGTEIHWLVMEAKWVECAHMNADDDEKPKPGWYGAYVAVYVGGKSDRWTCKPVVCLRATHWKPKPEPPAMNPKKARAKAKGER